MSKTLKYWRDGTHRLTLAEAALLIIEENPDHWVNSRTLFEEPPHGFIPIYRGIRTAATNILNEYALSEEDASETSIEYELGTDKAENVLSITEEDGLSVYVGQGQLRKWIKAKGIQAIFFTDESLTEFKVGEKEQGTTDESLTEFTRPRYAQRYPCF